MEWQPPALAPSMEPGFGGQVPEIPVGSSWHKLEEDEELQ